MLLKPVFTDKKSIFDVYDVAGNTYPENVLNYLKNIPFKGVEFYSKLRQLLPNIIRNRFLFHQEWTTVLEFERFCMENLVCEVIENREDKNRTSNFKIIIEAKNSTVSKEVNCSIKKEVINVPNNVDVTRLAVDFTEEGLLILRAPYVMTEEQRLLFLQEQFNFYLLNNPVDTITMPINKTLFNCEGFTLTQEMIELATFINKLVCRDPTRVLFPYFIYCTKTKGFKLLLNFCFRITQVNEKEIQVKINHEENFLNVELKQNIFPNKGQCGIDTTIHNFERITKLPKQLLLSKVEVKLLPRGILRCEIPVQFEKNLLPINGEPI